MGRPKGSKNKRSEQLQEIADRMNVNPFEILLKIAAGDWKGLGYDSPHETRFSPTGTKYKTDKITLMDRRQAASDALPYLNPKLKAVEISTDGETGAFAVIPTTPERLREAMSRDPILQQPAKKKVTKKATKKKAKKKTAKKKS